jgi:hypothetical protein
MAARHETTDVRNTRVTDVFYKFAGVRRETFGLEVYPTAIHYENRYAIPTPPN